MEAIDQDIKAFLERMQARVASRTPEQAAEAEKRQSEAEQLERTRTQNEIERLMRAFGVPRRVLASLSTIQQTKPVEAVERWAASPEDTWGLVLSADKGLGKSTAAGMWLTREAGLLVGRGAHHVSRRWWPASEIAALDFYGEAFEALCKSGALVLDDLGVEYSDAKGAFQAKLDRLLDARYRDYSRTIITTNLTAKAFRERYGERVYDRLCEGCTWASFTGASMRRAV